METSALAGLVVSLLTGLAILARLLFKRRLETEVRKQVEVEKQRDALKSYKETREKLDAVKDPRDTDIDELREWLLSRGNRKP